MPNRIGKLTSKEALQADPERYRRASANNMDTNIDRDSASSVDFTSLLPRGLPDDVFDDSALVSRKMSLILPQGTTDEGGRLPPFLPIRNNSDNDNLHLLPQQTEKEAFRHFLNLENATAEEKAKNIELMRHFKELAEDNKELGLEVLKLQETDDLVEMVGNKEVKPKPIPKPKPKPKPVPEVKIKEVKPHPPPPPPPKVEVKPPPSLPKKIIKPKPEIKIVDQETSSSEESSSDEENDYEKYFKMMMMGMNPMMMNSMMMNPMMMNYGMYGGYPGGYGGPSVPYGGLPYGQYPQPQPCVPAPKKKKKLCKNGKNLLKKNQGMAFDFLPHENCCTEVTLTIEPDDPDPLECAVENGIMPIVCCYMPPRLTLDHRSPGGVNTCKMTAGIPCTNSGNNNSSKGTTSTKSSSKSTSSYSGS